MHDKLMKKMMEKKGKKLDPMEQHAKMGVVQALSDQAGAMLGDKVKGLKKVDVASNSAEGLAAGLDKAKQMIKTKADMAKPDGLGEDAESAEEELHEDLDHDNEDGESAMHKALVNKPAYNDAHDPDNMGRDASPMDEEELSDKHPNEMNHHELHTHIEKLKAKLSKK